MHDKKEFLIDTDIFVDHLTHYSDEISYLEKAMLSGICFTTVLNASELYFAVRNDEEKTAVDNLLKSVKVLGIHARYSLLINSFRDKVSNLRDAVIVATAKINKLPIMTNYKEKYKFAVVELIDPKTL